VAPARLTIAKPPGRLIMYVIPRHRQCASGYYGDGRYRYACTLEVDHAGGFHEDHLTEAPSVYAWIKPELIHNPLGLPIMRCAPMLIGG
jgi:hypothetical protein